jgi:cobalt-zinc-cadmium efflux system membrane fusion protein
MTANGALVANGTIAFDENRVSVVAPRAEGRIVNVRTDLGQQVREGTPVASMLSPDVGQARGDLDRARATVDVARRNYEREKRLFEQSISPEKEMLDAEVAYRTAEADVRSAAARLESLGATNGQGASYSLLSPISGTVVARNAMPGQLAGPETNLFTIADLRNVWITVDVYSGDLARVRHGALATVTSGALPGENFIGHVTYAGGIVDPSSRTFKVRVEVENARLRLRPGVYAQVRIESAEAASNTGPITVPEIAVQDLDGTKVVFVAGAVPGRYVVRSIVLGSAVEGGVVAVQSGLVVGERVVTRGAFQLKAELTKASFGEKE